MTLQEALEILRLENEWRRGNVAQPQRHLSAAIDTVLEHHKAVACVLAGTGE